MEADPHGVVTKESKMCLIWQVPLIDKDTGNENGIVNGYVFINTEAEVIDKLDRLKVAELMPKNYPNEHVYILKGVEGKLLYKFFGQAEFKISGEGNQGVKV